MLFERRFAGAHHVSKQVNKSPSAWRQIDWKAYFICASSGVVENNIGYRGIEGTSLKLSVRPVAKVCPVKWDDRISDWPSGCLVVVGDLHSSKQEHVRSWILGWGGRIVCTSASGFRGGTHKFSFSFRWAERKDTAYESLGWVWLPKPKLIKSV